MQLLKIMNRILDIVNEPGASRAILTWSKFLATSYSMVRSLRAQQITPATVVDAGANVGQFCVAAYKPLRPMQVFAFEPLPKAYGELKRHIKTLKGVKV